MNDTPLSPMIVDGFQRLISVRTAADTAAAEIEQLLSVLTLREAEVMTLRFRLDRRGPPQTLEEVGDLIGASREQVRTIENSALAKLRSLQIQE